MNILKILIGLFLCSSALAQDLQIKGRIVDEQRKPVFSATVRCLTVDSALVNGVVSDDKGQFSLSVPSTDNLYTIIVSFVGYKDNIFRVKGNTSVLQLGDIQMVSDNKQLDEVVVTGQQMTRTTDKLIFFPSKEQLRQSSNGFNALAIMMIPRLDVDPFAKKVSTLQGATMLLINGRQASNEEIQNLNPKDILRVDFYDQHHPEYPLASSVIDYILIRRDGGGSIAFNGEQHLNKGTGAYSATGQFFKKKSEFAVYVNDAYNHYTKDRGTESVTHLGFPDGTIVNEQKSLPSLDKSNRINSYFNYIYQDEKSQFYTSAIFRQGDSDNDVWNMQTYSNEDLKYKVQDFSNSNNLNPALIMSFRRNLKNNQMLRIGLRGSYNNNKYDRIYRAFHDEDIANHYTTKAKEDFYNISPSVMFVKTAKNRNAFFISGSYDHTHTNTDYLIDGKNSKDHQTLTNSNVTMGYALRMVKGLRLTLQLGNYLHTFSNKEQSYVKYIFRPGLFAAYQLKPGHMLNASLGIGSGDPGVEYRAATEQQIDKYQIRRGNPDIETAKFYTASLDYSWDAKYVTLSYALKYDQMNDFPYDRVMYDRERDLFIHDYDPFGRSKVLMTGPRLRVKILPRKLTLDISGYYLWKNYDYWKSFTLNRIEASAKLLFVHKNIMASAQVASPKKEYSGGALVYMPVTYNFNVGYTIKNWHIEFATRNPFSSVVRTSDYNCNSYSRSSRIYAPRINDHVFYLTVNYRFNFGKKRSYSNIPFEDTGGSTILKAN